MTLLAHLVCAGCHKVLSYALLAHSCRCRGCGTLNAAQRLVVHCPGCEVDLVTPINTVSLLCPCCTTVIDIPEHLLPVVDDINVYTDPKEKTRMMYVSYPPDVTEAQRALELRKAEQRRRQANMLRHRKGDDEDGKATADAAVEDDHGARATTVATKRSSTEAQAEGAEQFVRNSSAGDAGAAFAHDHSQHVDGVDTRDASTLTLPATSMPMRDAPLFECEANAQATHDTSVRVPREVNANATTTTSTLPSTVRFVATVRRRIAEAVTTTDATAATVDAHVELQDVSTASPLLASPWACHLCVRMDDFVDITPDDLDQFVSRLLREPHDTSNRYSNDIDDTNKRARGDEPRRDACDGDDHVEDVSDDDAQLLDRLARTVTAPPVTTAAAATADAVRAQRYLDDDDDVVVDAMRHDEHVRRRSHTPRDDADTTPLALDDRNRDDVSDDGDAYSLDKDVVDDIDVYEDAVHDDDDDVCEDERQLDTLLARLLHERDAAVTATATQHTRRLAARRRAPAQHSHGRRDSDDDDSNSSSVMDVLDVSHVCSRRRSSSSSSSSSRSSSSDRQLPRRVLPSSSSPARTAHNSRHAQQQQQQHERPRHRVHAGVSSSSSSSSLLLLRRFALWQERKEAKRVQAVYEALMKEQAACTFRPQRVRSGRGVRATPRVALAHERDNGDAVMAATTTALHDSLLSSSSPSSLPPPSSPSRSTTSRASDKTDTRRVHGFEQFVRRMAAVRAARARARRAAAAAVARVTEARYIRRGATVPRPFALHTSRCPRHGMCRAHGHDDDDDGGGSGHTHAIAHDDDDDDDDARAAWRLCDTTRCSARAHNSHRNRSRSRSNSSSSKRHRAASVDARSPFAALAPRLRDELLFSPAMTAQLRKATASVHDTTATLSLLVPPSPSTPPPRRPLRLPS